VTGVPGADRHVRFEEQLEASRRGERRLVWKQLAAVLVVVAVVVVRQMWLA
jgi:hypothetical protein